MTKLGDMLPNEILANIVLHVDNKTLNNAISRIPLLRTLCTLRITDKQDNNNNSEYHGVNMITIQDINREKLDLDKLFSQYHFFEIELHNQGVIVESIKPSRDLDPVYLKTHKLLARLIRLKKVIHIKYLNEVIDINYLKMFKSLFYTHTDLSGVTHSKAPWYSIEFSNLKQVKSNCNHLLIGSNVYYPNLKALNLYYCSPKFYFEVLEYLNLSKYPTTFPRVTYLKMLDYMNEEEDLYSQHSNNYVRGGNDGDEEDDYYDDYDCNSDLDENEFYFDGLEIIQNYKLSGLQVLIIKNCNVSKVKKIYAPSLHTFEIFELSNKHTDAYDLNLIDSSNCVTRSFISSAVSTSCSLQQNNFPNLRTLKIIGHLKLTDFSKNTLDLDEIQHVVIKGCNVEIIDKESFWDVYHGSNHIALEVL